VAALAKRIEFAITRPDQSDLIAMRGRRHVIERFGMERMVAAVEGLYDEAVGNSLRSMMQSNWSGGKLNEKRER
jgi:hypothetical protein